ncbi:hypothetical protein H4N64_32800 [Streptomyces sp. PSKA01]|uniref:Uncharacterized protein n=1 Tax=Streptomyces cupreus TaxID=2759956 RepID=A0A7X1J8M1_9ACTN|nr:hypothetical protein [Streptomyces cupreus]
MSRRRPLYAHDQVWAARLALAVSTVTAVAGTALGAARGTTMPTLTTALAGLALITTAAGLVLARAQTRRRTLRRLRDLLQQDLF